MSGYPDQMVELYAPRWAADPVRSERLARYVQTCATPRQAARLLRMSLSSDISEVLPLVQAPTLILHPREQKVAPADRVREFAELISNARFREIPGDAGFVFVLDVELIADIVEEFVTGTAPSPATDRVLATVLFTDLVDSTRRAAEAGDRAWSDMLERHLDRAQAAVAAHGGETVKTTGDGVLAIFTGPGQGVRCATQIVTDAQCLGLDVRSGLHTGEVERSPSDVSGLAVHLAARITVLAGAGEVLASGTSTQRRCGRAARWPPSSSRHFGPRKRRPGSPSEESTAGSTRRRPSPSCTRSPWADGLRPRRSDFRARWGSPPRLKHRQRTADLGVDGKAARRLDD